MTVTSRDLSNGVFSDSNVERGCLLVSSFQLGNRETRDSYSYISTKGNLKYTARTNVCGATSTTQGRTLQY